MKYSLGLLGYPLLGSLSPHLHSAALKCMGLEGEYHLYPIPEGEQGEQPMRELFNRLRNGRIQGLNVTLPHKQRVIPFLDDLTPAAQAIGAVNTILVQEGKLIGENTDAPGFWADLKRVFPHAESEAGAGGIALVLGAGGAARAVVHALTCAGWKVLVAARRQEQAQALVKDLRFGDLQALNLSPQSLQPHLPSLRLIVNATSAGMIPNVNVSPWPEDLPFPTQAFLYDLIYKPRRTILMHRAGAAGLQVANGLGMLVEQAALALECWTGQAVPRQAMWDAIAERDRSSAEKTTRGF